MSSTKHVPVLDGIRGLAIALVMFHHFFHGIDAGSTVADKAIFSLAYRGWIGVDLFFVLSGYLITGILFDAKGKDGYFRNFYARRVLRIFPAYYLTLLVFFVVLPNFDFGKEYMADSAPDAIWHWTYLTNFRIAYLGEWYRYDLPNVFWSLAIEEQFYMVWPFVVLMCSRRALLRVCAFLFVGTLAGRFALSLMDGVSWVTPFVMTPTRLDGLAVGAFVAMLARGDGGLKPHARWSWLIFLVGAVPALYLETQHGKNWEEDPIQSLRFTGYALMFGALLITTASATSKWNPFHIVFASRPLRFLGKYSYALYLWHGPVDHFLGVLYHPHNYSLILGSRVPAALIHSLLAGVLSVIVALLSWHLVEKHFLKLKGRFETRS